MQGNKWLALLQSRKFWASMISIAVAVGMLEYSDEQQAKLVEAIVVVAGAIGYIISLAVEDGMSKVAASQDKLAEAQRITNIRDAIQGYNTQRAIERQAEQAASSAERAARR